MSQYLRDSIPQSSMHVLRGARHLTPVEHPDLVSGHLARLLHQSEKSAAASAS
jgi:hypothetical protein